VKIFTLTNAHELSDTQNNQVRTMRVEAEFIAESIVKEAEAVTQIQITSKDHKNQNLSANTFTDASPESLAKFIAGKLTDKTVYKVEAVKILEIG